MKVTLGMIVKDLVSVSPVLDFLENAKKYGHDIHSVIIAYSNNYDPSVVDTLEKYAEIRLVPVNHNHIMNAVFKYMDISEKSRNELLFSKPLAKGGLTPYGFNRNTVLIEAILQGSDVLVFIDSDVLPYVLVETENGVEFEDVDFIGTHIAGIQKGANMTTCEYSGYNILPVAKFEGMDELLFAMQKEHMAEFWQTSETHGGLTVQKNKVPQITETEKILGGNMAIDLTRFQDLIPFYSPHYYVHDTLHLARGEDTLMTFEFGDKGCFCDVDMHLFHDTFASYPKIPNLKTDPTVQERFFHACMGWVGRNPFLNWLNERDVLAIKESQVTHLRKGVPALVAYTGNPIYNILFDAIEISYDNLEDSIAQYHNLQEAWAEFILKAERGITSANFNR